MKQNIGSFAVHGAAKALLAIVIACFGFMAAVFAAVGFVPSEHHGSNTTYSSLFDDLTGELAIAETLSVNALTGRFVLYGAVVVACLLAAFFFIQLYRIVRSAERGDPFTVANARRLATMGWILLAPVGIGILGRIALAVPPDTGAIMNMGVVALAGLVLLILARVFRHGAAMREDLEGTV